MAKTFTGLKLQGTLGKFGKKEISDIEGCLELMSTKVVSGTEWGNMLLWDGDLCQLEISRKNGKSCHKGDIQKIIIGEEDVTTIGIDGYIRVNQLKLWLHVRFLPAIFACKNYSTLQELQADQTCWKILIYSYNPAQNLK